MSTCGNMHRDSESRTWLRARQRRVRRHHIRTHASADTYEGGGGGERGGNGSQTAVVRVITRHTAATTTTIGNAAIRLRTSARSTVQMRTARRRRPSHFHFFRCSEASGEGGRRSGSWIAPRVYVRGATGWGDSRTAKHPHVCKRVRYANHGHGVEKRVPRTYGCAHTHTDRQRGHSSSSHGSTVRPAAPSSTHRATPETSWTAFLSSPSPAALALTPAIVSVHPPAPPASQ